MALNSCYSIYRRLVRLQLGWEIVQRWQRFPVYSWQDIGNISVKEQRREEKSEVEKEGKGRRSGKALDQRRIGWLDGREPTAWFVPAWWNASGTECASGMLIADRSSRAEPSSKSGRAEPNRARRAVGPASPPYNSVISPGAYLFRTWNSPRQPRATIAAASQVSRRLSSIATTLFCSIAEASIERTLSNVR